MVVRSPGHDRVSWPVGVARCEPQYSVEAVDPEPSAITLASGAGISFVSLMRMMGGWGRATITPGVSQSARAGDASSNPTRAGTSRGRRMAAPWRGPYRTRGEIGPDAEMVAPSHEGGTPIRIAGALSARRRRRAHPSRAQRERSAGVQRPSQRGAKRVHAPRTRAGDARAAGAQQREAVR